MTEPFDVDMFLTELNQWARRREICRVWGCAPEEADRLDTPLRWAAWDVWVREQGGNAVDFFMACRSVMTVFRTFVDRRVTFAREVIVPQGRWLRTPYEAKRCGIIMGDAVMALLPFHPSIVVAIAEDAKIVWPVYAGVIAACVSWFVLYRNAGWTIRTPNVHDLYAHYARHLMTLWERAQAAEAAA
jgi:hypothetical protein